MLKDNLKFTELIKVLKLLPIGTIIETTGTSDVLVVSLVSRTVREDNIGLNWNVEGSNDLFLLTTGNMSRLFTVK